MSLNHEFELPFEETAMNIEHASLVTGCKINRVGATNDASAATERRRFSLRCDHVATLIRRVPDRVKALLEVANIISAHSGTKLVAEEAVVLDSFLTEPDALRSGVENVGVDLDWVRLQSVARESIPDGVQVICVGMPFSEIVDYAVRVAGITGCARASLALLLQSIVVDPPNEVRRRS